MDPTDVCYNDCIYNRTVSKPQTRCYICQIKVHNVCLGVPKKSIGSGAWACRECRQSPEIIRILHDLVVGLYDKVERLDEKISAMKKQESVLSVSSQTDTTCGINPLHEHSAPLPRDVNSIGNGTNNAPLHYDIVDLSTQPDNTSATVSYLNDMLEGLEESITDEVTQSSRSSSASETETNHTKQHVYIGKTPRETTVKEMFALLYNIGVKYICNIKRVSKYNHQYVSFCVTLQDPHDMAIVFKYPWRGGIVVETFRNRTWPDSPRGPLYTQRYGHSPRHDRINKRNVPAPRHRRRSSQDHLNIVTSPDSPLQQSSNNNESAEHSRSRRTRNQATRNFNSVTPVLTTNHVAIAPLASEQEHLTSNNQQPALRAHHSHTTSTQQHTPPQPQASPTQVVPPQYAFPQQGVTPNWAYPAMLNLFAQMFNASMLYNQHHSIARANIPDQAQYALTATTLSHDPVHMSTPLARASHIWRPEQ